MKSGGLVGADTIMDQQFQGVHDWALHMVQGRVNVLC